MIPQNRTNAQVLISDFKNFKFLNLFLSKRQSHFKNRYTYSYFNVVFFSEEILTSDIFKFLVI